MKKIPFKLIIILSILIIIPYSCITALGKKDWTTEGRKALYNHPDFISTEKEWGDKLGQHLVVNLTDNRILEFEQIDTRVGGGKYAGLKGIGEFKLSSYVEFNGESYWKDTYGSHVRFQDLSQLLGIKIETMIDCIDNYDKILELVKKLAREQYLTSPDVSLRLYRERASRHKDIIKEFPNHFVLSENRIACIYVLAMYDWIAQYEWDEKIPADKLRKSLGLE